MADHASANLVSTLDDVATAVDEDVLKRIGLGLARTSRTTKRSIAAVIVALIMLAEAGSITLFLGTVFMFSFLYGLIRLTRR